MVQSAASSLTDTLQNNFLVSITGISLKNLFRAPVTTTFTKEDLNVENMLNLSQIG